MSLVTSAMCFCTECTSDNVCDGSEYMAPHASLLRKHLCVH